MEKRRYIIFAFLSLSLVMPAVGFAGTTTSLKSSIEEMRCLQLLDTSAETVRRERLDAIQKLKKHPTLENAFAAVDKIFSFEGYVQAKNKRGHAVNLQVSKTGSADGKPWIRITLSDPASVRQDGDRTFFYKEDQFNISREPYLDVRMAESGFINGQVYILMERGPQAQQEDLGPIHEYLLVDVDPSGSVKKVMIANGFLRAFASLWDRLNIVLNGKMIVQTKIDKSNPRTDVELDETPGARMETSSDQIARK